MDDEFLATLMEFFKYEVEDEGANDDRYIRSSSMFIPFRIPFDTKLVIPKFDVDEKELRMYFERLFLQPVRMNVSFSKTQAVGKDEDQRPRGQNIFSYVFDVFAMAVGNIHVSICESL